MLLLGPFMIINTVGSLGAQALVAGNRNVSKYNILGRSNIDGVPTISTVVGTPGFLGGSYSGDGGFATQATLFFSYFGNCMGSNCPGPAGAVALDSHGNLFIADTYNCIVREVSAKTGLIFTIAGIPRMCGFSGDGGPATKAQLGQVDGVAVDSAGNVFISDSTNQRVREISKATGDITTIAGTGTAGLTGLGGPASAAQLYYPGSLVIDTRGDVLISVGQGAVEEIATTSHSQFGMSMVSGSIYLVAGGGTSSASDIPATSEMLGALSEIAIGPSGDLYVGQFTDCKVSKIDASTGILLTVAGSGTGSLSCSSSAINGGNGGNDGQSATSVTFGNIGGITVDQSGNVFISDTNYNRVWEVSATTGIVTSFAGIGKIGLPGDGGPATQASVYDPASLAISPSGQLFIEEQYANQIREVGSSIPLINSITPEEGISSGGETVTLGGSGLLGASAVYFGSQAATSFSIISDTEIQTVAPALPAEPVNTSSTCSPSSVMVTVIGPGITSYSFSFDIHLPTSINRGHGYWLASSNATITTLGDACSYTPKTAVSSSAYIVAISATPDGGGYWLAASDGGVFAYGDANFFGSPSNLKLSAPVVAIAATPDGGGYWLAASDGGVFAYGDANFFGSPSNLKLSAPVVGIAATPDGGGYWLAASDGGVFAYGDANFFGSPSNLKLSAPVVAIAATPDGGGYWLAASDGGVFAYGDANFFGSPSNLKLSAPVVAIAATPDGGGYWLAVSDGGVFAYGEAGYFGNAISGGNLHSTVGIARCLC